MLGAFNKEMISPLDKSLSGGRESFPHHTSRSLLEQWPPPMWLTLGGHIGKCWKVEFSKHLIFSIFDFRPLHGFIPFFLVTALLGFGVHKPQRWKSLIDVVASWVHSPSPRGVWRYCIAESLRLWHLRPQVPYSNKENAVTHVLGANMPSQKSLAPFLGSFW